LRALKDVDGFVDALAGRIVTLEALLLGLCDRHGPEDVRQRVQALSTLDKVIRICFSTVNRDPRDGLISYYESLAGELDPLILWNPRSGG
ncbi:MAG: hypothetical protein IH956_02005, partial [Chloroflexi bacterium]|nr:hypothetical protein [Chloroflexota bacterium]